MAYRKALRKRKHLEEEEEDPSREHGVHRNCLLPPSEASNTSDKDYKPGPDEETTSSGPEESPRPLAASSSSSTASRKPTRCTVYRRKKTAAKDRAVLAQAAESGPQGTPGGPCDICGHPRRLESGHAFYQGQFFCSMADGSGGRTPQQWLAERRGPADVSIPRTTLWRMKKAFDEEEEEAAAGSSQPEKKKRKPHKLRTCQRCGQPAQKDFGHSQLNRPGHRKEDFCALYEGKSLELWLAERRAGAEGRGQN